MCEPRTIKKGHLGQITDVHEEKQFGNKLGIGRQMLNTGGRAGEVLLAVRTAALLKDQFGEFRPVLLIILPTELDVLYIVVAQLGDQEEAGAGVVSASSAAEGDSVNAVFWG